jgi:glutamate carboxypeptidase
MQTDGLARHLEEQLPRHLALLEDWVGVNTHSANAEGVNELGRRTAAAFARLGFEAEAHPSARPGAGSHVLLTRGPAKRVPPGAARTVAMVSHLDTVFTRAEEEANDFRFRVEGDKIYGPGVGDIKGGTLMALMVLDALHAVRPAAFASVAWAVGLNANEERLDGEFNELFRRHLTGPVAAVLVFEAGADWPGRWPVVVARKGRAEFRIDVEGRGAHAGSNFWAGRNAVLDAAHLALEVARVSDRGKDRTVNVGWLQGGTETNRVPHAAVIKGEMRAFEGDYLDEGLERVGRIVDGFVVAGGRATVSVVERLPPWPANEATARLFAVWKAAGRSLGLDVVEQQRGGLSDGNLFWSHHPTLDGLGPVGAHFHCSQRSADGSKEQEFVRRSSFVPKALLNCTALLSLLGAETGACSP